MAKTFRPLTFDLIEEGRLKKSLDEEIARVAKALLKHVNTYGEDMTKKSRAEVTLKISFAPGADGVYSVKAAIATKLPGRPIHETLAIHEQEQTGEETLFVRASGSDNSEPRQLKLATQDGRPIDPATGEIMAPKANDANPKKEG